MADPNTVPSHVLAATGPGYLKTATDETLRTSPFLSLLREAGRVTGESGGYSWTRAVRYKKSTGRGYQRGANINYAPKDEYINVSFGTRHMMDDDSIDLLDVTQNGGMNKMVDLWSVKYPNLADGMRERLQRGVFLDGTASGNEDQLNGLETIFKQDLTVAVVAADRVAIPAGTYCGQNTKPGTKGGTWSADLATPSNAAFGGDYPFGSGDAQYDWYSPKLFHTLSSAWNNTTDTWADNCLDILTAMAQTIELSSGDMLVPKYAPMGDLFMLEFKAKLRSNQREILPHVAGRDLGFGDAIEFEGMMTKKDFFCPSNAAYALNPSAAEMIYMKKPPQGFEHLKGGGEDSMMFGFGPTQAPNATWYGMGVFFFGDLWFRPKHFAKAADFTT